MKVLNLDKLAVNIGRKLVIAGVSYPIDEMTVFNFIETTKAAERLAGASILEQVEATIEMLLRSVPSISKEVLVPLKLQTLELIVSFVRGDDVDGVEVVEDTAEKK